MNITVDRAVIEQALEALDYVMRHGPAVQKAKDLLRTALEQPEQEPVAWMLGDKFYKVKQCRFFSKNPGEEIPGQIPLYTAPPQRKPLSLDELWRVFTRSGLSQFHHRDGVVEYKYEKCIEEFARAVEAAHGIKD